VSYTAAATVAVAVVVALDVAVLRTRLVGRRVFWVSYLILLCFQLLLNAVLTGRGVVRYAHSAILGPRVAYAPVEDLLFGFALILLSQAWWVWLGRRGVQR
jgi:lycopene cyclase domain-containing protein